MNALILKLDVSGRPVSWLTREQTALLYCRDEVLWEAGFGSFLLRGGCNRVSGTTSVLNLSTIIGTRSVCDKRVPRRSVPLLTNSGLFERDQHMCLYCGGSFRRGLLTRDHVVPVSKGGLDIWENVVTACRSCNQRKADKSLERLGLVLLAVPYVPNEAEALILSNREILADQMAFLRARVGAGSRWVLAGA